MATVRKIRPISLSKNVRIVFSSSFCVETLRPVPLENSVSHCSEVVKMVVKLENVRFCVSNVWAIHRRRNLAKIGDFPGRLNTRWNVLLCCLGGHFGVV